MDAINLTSKLTYLSAEKVKKIKKALEYADQAHAGQQRFSGDKYIIHPVAVAEILAEMTQDENTIIAGLLHDVVEDAGISLVEISDKFGEEVAFLVEAVTKLSGYKFKGMKNIQAENIRRMLMSMAKDMRVIIIKVADRLHNMRTLQYLPKEKQKRIAQETLDIYAPLAHRLGMGLVKWELEDLCLRYLEPDVFQEMKNKVSMKRKDREGYTSLFMKDLAKLLKDSGLSVEMSGRAKHFYSIYNKMVSQNLSFNEIYDLIAIRVLTNSEQDCYSVLGIIHSKWKPIQGKIKDYIAMPKANMYQSLHTTVVGPQGRPVEVQIRTKEMHEISEYGIAAHWLYKAIDKSKQGKKKLTQKEKDYLDHLSWLRKLMETQADENLDAQDFVKNLKTDFLADEIFVFSPKGDVYSLPVDATPVDFAFGVHTAVGYSCIGAKVNGKIVPLSQALQNGDIVEIMRGKEALPNPDWLLFVKTSHTKNKIKNFLNKLQKEEKIKTGKEKVLKEIKNAAISKANFRKVFPDILEYYDLGESDIYYAIAKGDISIRAFIDIIREKLTNEKEVLEQPVDIIQSTKLKQSEPKNNNNFGVEIDGDSSNIMFSMAKCCSPIYGDDIIGVISRMKGISVHRKDCSNIKGLKDKKIEVHWQQAIDVKYSTQIVIIGYDRVGWFKDVLNLIAEKKINVTEASASHKGTVTSAKITIEINDNDQLEEILAQVRQLKDIYEAYRI